MIEAVEEVVVEVEAIRVPEAIGATAEAASTSMGLRNPVEVVVKGRIRTFDPPVFSLHQTIDPQFGQSPGSQTQKQDRPRFQSAFLQDRRPRAGEVPRGRGTVRPDAASSMVKSGLQGRPPIISFLS